MTRNTDILSHENTLWTQGISAIMVMLMHFIMQIEGYPRIVNILGSIGVAAFLFISGFGLNESYKKSGLAGYWHKRIVRVIIPCWLVFLFKLPFEEQFSLSRLVHNLLFTDSELWFVDYIVRWYIIYWLARRLSPRHTTKILAGFSVAFIFAQQLMCEQAFSFFCGYIVSQHYDKVRQTSRGRIIKFTAAAFAYGTETVPQVNKITGPGNSYVAMAKKAVVGTVGIDSIAGPSEVLVIADESANPVFVAADMLAQAEHDERAAALCVTDSLSLAQRVQDEVERQCAALKRNQTARASIDRYGAIVVLEDLSSCVQFANDVAPEHLEILTADPRALLPGVRHAGGVFLGAYAPEALGDYLAGTNHVLPTGGTAKYASPLGVYDFCRRMSVLEYDAPRLQAVVEDIVQLADTEGLQAHAQSALARF